MRQLSVGHTYASQSQHATCNFSAEPVFEIAQYSIRAQNTFGIMPMADRGITYDFLQTINGMFDCIMVD